MFQKRTTLAVVRAQGSEGWVWEEARAVFAARVNAVDSEH
jgi:hypothetical protein